MSKKASYVALVGTNADVLDALFDALGQRPGPNDREVRVISNLLTSTTRSRTLVRMFDGARVSLTDYTPMMSFNHVSSPMNFADDERVLLVQATGRAVEQSGATIVDAIGLDDDDVVPFTQFGLPDGVALGPAGSILDTRELMPLVSFARWRAMSAKPPLLISHVAEPGDFDREDVLFRSVTSTYIRPYVLHLVLNSDQRDRVNDLLRSMSTGSTAEPLVPFRASCVFADASSPLERSASDSGDIVAVAKTPLTARDGRKLGRALTEAMAQFPNLGVMAALMTDTRTEDLDRPQVDETSGPAPEVPAVTLREVEELRAELDQARGLIRAGEERLSALRRELRAAHYELSKATAQPESSEAQPALDQDLAGEITAPARDGLDPAEHERLAALTPETFDEVFELAREHLPLVALCDKADARVQELTGNAKTPVWVARTWAILVSLHDFATARAAGGGGPNLRSYMNSLPHPLFAPNQVSVNESNLTATNTKMRKERTFPVPVDVDPSGWAFMEAHVRVDSGGKYPAPRLYFLDDTNGATGQVHVGYVGPHLTNFRTN